MKKDKINNNSQSDHQEVDDFSPITRAFNVSPREDVWEETDNVTEKPVPKEFNKKIIIKVCVCILSVAAVCMAALGVYGATLPKSTILNGVTVGNAKLGGKTPGEATDVMNDQINSVVNEVIINANGKRYVVRPDDIDAIVDIEGTVNKAMNIAKDGNVFSNAVSALKIKFSGGNLVPVITYNQEKFLDVINKIGQEAVGSTLKPHSVRFDQQGRAFIVPGTSGFSPDSPELVAKFNKALAEADTDEVKLDIDSKSPEPLTIEALDAMVYLNPQDARFVIDNGNVVILPSVDGRYIDKEYCKALLPMVKEGGTEIEVPYSVSPAAVRAEDLEGKLFNDNLGSYTTRYAAGGNRGSNVAIAAAKINGTVVLPGEIFSFNDTVGKRTVANGFKIAPEYQNGQTVDGVGGGTCQVSTTLYSALLYADMKIVKRLNHSMSVSYVPLGQDATVTDGGIDLKFQNDTNYPVKISAVTGGGKITVTIVGTTPEIARTVKIVHTSLAAESGSAVKTTRYVYDVNGGILKEESMGVSKYKPHPTAAPSEAPAETENVEALAPTEITEPVLSQKPEQSYIPQATETAQPETTKNPVTLQPTNKPELTPTKIPVQATEDQTNKTPVKVEE